MTDTLVWFALICSALGTGVTAWTSSGVGRLHPLDARELRRQRRFEDILSLHVEETRPSRPTLPAVAPEPVGPAPCDACGTSPRRGPATAPAHENAPHPRRTRRWEA